MNPPLELQDRSLCLLISGGVDSCILLADLLAAGNSVWPVYVRFGLRWEALELAYLRRFLAAVGTEGLHDLRVLDCQDSGLYEGHWSVTGEATPGAETTDEAVYLPGRNVLLLACSSVFCARQGIHTILLGTLAANPFADATPEFFAAYAKAAAMGLGLEEPFEIVTPYAKMRKAELVRRGARLPLQHAFSCLHPIEGRHCGDCNKCAERQRAFREAEVVDPTTYAAAASSPVRRS